MTNKTTSQAEAQKTSPDMSSITSEEKEKEKDFSPPCHETSLVTSLITSSVVGGLVSPVIASVLTLGFYLSPPFLFLPQLAPKWGPIVFGIICTGLAWPIVTALVHPFVAEERADTQLYAQIRSSWDTLSHRLQALDGKIPAVRKARAYHEYVKGYLEKAPDKCPVDLRWISGTGYLNASRMLHRAEEALTIVEETRELIRRGLHDKYELEKSTMSNRDEWHQHLLLAIKRLDPSTSVYVEENQPWKDYEERLNTLTEQIEEYFKSHHHSGMAPQKTVGDNDQHARIIFQGVRRALNTHRENLWESMLLLRNHILGALVCTELVSYALICLLVLIGVDRNAMAAGLAFYIVGAIAGLFGRFYGELSRTDITGDYGLSIVRLIATPMFSGLAGIAGALLTVVITVLSGQQTSSPTLEQIFQPAPLNLFIAAVFGLTPNLVMQSLQRQAEAYKAEVKPTEAQPPTVGTQKV